MMRRLSVLVLLVLLALAAPPAIRHLRERPPVPAPAVRLALEPPAGAEFGGGGLPFDGAIAPSGEEVVFVATTAGESRLWRRRLDAYRAEAVADSTGATLPAYSADGRTLWFFAGRKLHSLNLDTGERRSVADAADAGGVSIRRDGSVLFATGGRLQRIAEGAVTAVGTLRPGERSHAFPAWTDTGDAFIYLVTREDGRRTIRLAHAQEDVELTRADSHGIVSAGHVLFVRDQMLRAEPLDLPARRLGPRAVPLELQVGVSSQGRGAFAVGGHVLASGPPAQPQYVLQWFDDRGPRDAISEPGDFWQVRLSPDERTAAVTTRDPLLGTLDVFTVPTSGGAAARLTLALAADTDPVWSPDGRRVAFRSAQDGQPQLYARTVASRDNTDEVLWRSPADEVPTDWTRGLLLFHARMAASGFDIWALPFRPAGEPRALVHSGFNEVDGRLSPDGRWLAYASDEGGQYDVYISRVDDPARRTRVSTAGGTRPQWVANGRAVVFARGAELLRAALSFDRTSVHASTPEPVLQVPGARDAAASHDDVRFLVIAPRSSVQERHIAVLVGWRALVHSQ